MLRKSCSLSGFSGTLTIYSISDTATTKYYSKSENSNHFNEYATHRIIFIKYMVELKNYASIETMTKN